MKNRLHLLVTGFGPFPGVARNPSAEIARRVAQSPRWRCLGIEARAVVLSTTYSGLDRELRPLLEDGGFDALLMIGVASRSNQIRVERRGSNRVSILAPDAEKARPPRLTLEGGSSPRRSRVIAEKAVLRLRSAGLPCRASRDAGRYLCNASYFRALALPQPVLFLHIPRPPRAARRRAPAAPARRSSWYAQVGDAFVDIALDMLREARRDCS